MAEEDKRSDVVRTEGERLRKQAEASNAASQQAARDKVIAEMKATKASWQNSGLGDPFVGAKANGQATSDTTARQSPLPDASTGRVVTQPTPIKSFPPAEGGGPTGLIPVQLYGMYQGQPALFTLAAFGAPKPLPDT